MENATFLFFKKDVYEKMNPGDSHAEIQLNADSDQELQEIPEIALPEDSSDREDIQIRVGSDSPDFAQIMEQIRSFGPAKRKIYADALRHLEEEN